MKFIRSVLITVFLIAITIWISFNYLIPEMVAESIEKGEMPTYLPKKFEPVFDGIKERVDQDIAELPAILSTHNLTFEELLQIVEQTRPGEILPVIKEFQNKEITDSNQAFDIIVENLGHKVENPESFRDAFNERFTAGRLQTAMSYINDSDLPLEVNVELSRKIVIEILKDRQEEIESELNRIGE